MTVALERIRDPLVEAVLGVAQAAANADLADRLDRLGYTETDEAVKSTLNYPIESRLLGGELSLPVLSAYAVEQRPRRTTFYHIDQAVKLRLHYVTPAVAHDRIDERWPILGVVWRAIWAALLEGKHEDYLEGACALDDAGVRWIEASPIVRYGFLPGGDFAYLQMLADVDLLWRPQDGVVTELYPMLGADLVISQAGDVSSFDVRTYATTPTGDEELDAEPFEEEAVLP